MLKMQCKYILCSLYFWQFFSLPSSLFVSFYLPASLILYFTDEYFKVGCLSLPTADLSQYPCPSKYPPFSPPCLSVAAFARVHCPAKVVAQHPRECHPFSILMDQDLLKLSHLGEFYQDCEPESWINSSLQCMCGRESWEFSLELNLPGTGSALQFQHQPAQQWSVCNCRDSRATLDGESSGDRL